ncbi:MAG: hypothetical protein MZV65_31625 [Chromatiales bacterium]|nr:hypothetical protein [Chromatiales bacterium]
MSTTVRIRVGANARRGGEHAAARARVPRARSPGAKRRGSMPRSGDQTTQGHRPADCLLRCRGPSPAQRFSRVDFSQIDKEFPARRTPDRARASRISRTTCEDISPKLHQHQFQTFPGAQAAAIRSTPRRSTARSIQISAGTLFQQRVDGYRASVLRNTGLIWRSGAAVATGRPRHAAGAGDAAAGTRERALPVVRYWQSMGRGNGLRRGTRRRYVRWHDDGPGRTGQFCSFRFSARWAWPAASSAPSAMALHLAKDSAELKDRLYRQTDDTGRTLEELGTRAQARR